jgi:FAD/FMN-containing dehydrogenase
MLSGWGNYPRERCYVSQPGTLELLQTIVTTGEQPSYIPRGLGRAYGDAALNCQRGVIVQTRFNRFLAFDDRTGILECEAGVSLAEVIAYLLPRGWFIPTTPGTKYVTIGGAIAADVHGKNHHVDGAFGTFVLDLKLLTASGEILSCSPLQNADVFWATIGGMGLTGIIVSARIQLKKAETAYCDVTYQRTAHLDELLERFTATDRDYHYSVAWIDCLAAAQSLGRAVLMLANDVKASDLPASLQRHALTVPAKRTKTVPFCCPIFLLNPWSVKAFNALYYAKHREGRWCVDYDTFFYPLDNVQHWNRLYGRRGFVQYQALLPLETSRCGLIALLEKIVGSKRASFLAVLKSTGPASQGMLSYPYPGHTLALDFLNTGEDLHQLVRELDAILLKHGGRLYLAKDSMMTSDIFDAMYPRLPEFKEVKAKIDPNARFVSSQARRLGIVGLE